MIVYNIFGGVASPVVTAVYSLVIIVYVDSVTISYLNFNSCVDSASLASSTSETELTFHNSLRPKTFIFY